MAVVNVIDIGTHSVRSLVANVAHQAGTAILSESRIVTQLGEGLNQTGELSLAAVDRGLAALQTICDEADKFGASKTRAVATCAIREARNGPEFVRLAKERTGLDIEVISAEQEIGLCHLGIIDHHLCDSNKLIIADLGGGSLEVMMAFGSEVEAVIPTQLGAVRTTEMFDLAERISDERERTARNYIAKTLREAGVPRHHNDHSLVVCGGTALALAALVEQCPVKEDLVNSASHRWEGREVTLDQATAMASDLKLLDACERAAYTGLSVDRAAVMVAGVWALIELMQHIQVGSFVLAVYGIRRGLLCEMAASTG